VLMIACCGRKGGSGKTALALSLAGAYARKGLRVLLVDLDPQGSASLVLGADASGADLCRVLAGHADAETVTCDTIFDGLALLPGGPDLEDLDGCEDLRACLPAADVVLVDCPPGHTRLDRLGIDAADVVLACCEPHRLGIAGAARVLDEAGGRNPAPLRALVLARVDERRGLDKTAPDLLADAFKLPVFTVRQDAALAGALNDGNLPPATGRAADDVARLCRWIKRQTKGEE